MIEKCRDPIEWGGTCRGLLNDLSKALDCLPHDFLIVKVHAFRLDVPPITLMYSCFSNRKERVKINDPHKNISFVLYYFIFYVESIFLSQILALQIILMTIYLIQLKKHECIKWPWARFCYKSTKMVHKTSWKRNLKNKLYSWA